MTVYLAVTDVSVVVSTSFRKPPAANIQFSTNYLLALNLHLR